MKKVVQSKKSSLLPLVHSLILIEIITLMISFGSCKKLIFDHREEQSSHHAKYFNDRHNYKNHGVFTGFENDPGFGGENILGTQVPLILLLKMPK